MIVTSESKVILSQDYSERHKEAIAEWKLGFRTSNFPEGAIYRLWGAHMLTNCEFYDSSSHSNRKIGGEGVHALLLTADSLSITEWEEISSKDGTATARFPKLDKCILYSTKQLATVKYGFRMIPNSDWTAGDFEKGLCCPSKEPDSVECTRLLPHSVEDLVEKPQFAVPSNVWNGCGLATKMLKEAYFKTLEVQSSGIIKCESKPNKVGLIDIELWINDLIAHSQLADNGVKYVKVRSCYTADQYRTLYRGELGKPSRVGYLELMG